MNEKILKTLMQLFAIIAPAQGNETDRRKVVETYLKRQLNQEGVIEYLKIFDDYYSGAQLKLRKGYEARRNSAISVRIIKICIDIGNQLTFNQKIVVLVQLLEYCKSDNSKVSQLELEFIMTAADQFNIDRDDYQLLEHFIISPYYEIPDSSHVLIIDNKADLVLHNAHHLYNETVKGQVRVLKIPSTEMLFVRSFGTGELFMSGQLMHEDKVYLFNRGSSLKYHNSAPVYFSDVMRVFLDERLMASRVVYEVKNIEYRFREGNVGLHGMSFAEESGRLIGIMGASGAGKSTLLNYLTAAGVLAEDKLFATLDPTTRLIHLPNRQEALLTDTVGFIHKLPHQLIAAFRATLEEVIHADLLLHVVDASHPRYQEQSDAVFHVLRELGAESKSILTVFNKIDRIDNDFIKERLTRQEGNTAISALTGEGIDHLLEAIGNALHEKTVDELLRIPYDCSNILSELYDTATVQNVDYRDDGVYVTVSLTPDQKGRYKIYSLDTNALGDEE